MHSNATIKYVSWPHFSWATLYSALYSGQMSALSTVLSGELKRYLTITKTKPMRKKEGEVRPGFREISSVSIYGEVYAGKDLRKRYV